MGLLQAESKAKFNLKDLLVSDQRLNITFSHKQKEKTVLFSFPYQDPLDFIAYYYPEELSSYPSIKKAERLKEIPNRTKFLIVRYKERYRAFLCLSHHNIDSFFCLKKKSLKLKIRQLFKDESNKVLPALISLTHHALEPLIEAAMQQALKLTGEIGRPIGKQKALPEWLQTLGWDSAKISIENLSHSQVLDSVKAWLQAGIKLNFIILGKGWQHLQVDDKKVTCLLDFEADPIRFPKGLKGLIDDLRTLGIKKVGVYHDALGATGGLHVSVAKKFRIKATSSNQHYLGQNLGDTFNFFFQFYRFLKKQGVDFVQVDYGSIAHVNSKYSWVNVMLKNLEIAIQAAAAIQFSYLQFVLHGLRAENLFYWGTAKVVQANACHSIENQEELKLFIRAFFQQSYWLNELAFSYFGPLSFPEKGEELLFQCMALSGTVLTFSSLEPPKSKKWIKKLSLPSGQVLAAKQAAKPMPSSLFAVQNDKVADCDKVYTWYDNVLVIGALNLQSTKKPFIGKVQATELKLPHDEQRVVFSYRKGFIGKKRADDEILVKLKPFQADIFHFFPIQNQTAVIGCHKFFLPSAGIQQVSIEDEFIHVSSKVTGPLLVYCEKEVIEVHRDGKLVEWDFDQKLSLLSIEGAKNVEEKESFYIIRVEN